MPCLLLTDNILSNKYKLSSHAWSGLQLMYNNYIVYYVGMTRVCTCTSCWHVQTSFCGPLTCKYMQIIMRQLW